MTLTTSLRFALLGLCTLALPGCITAGDTKPPLKTVDHVDLDRYVGRWYVIANIPYFLENGKVASYDTYSKLPGGRLGNNFTFRRGSLDAPEVTWHGKADVVNTQTNAEWSVQFVWPFTASYLVIDLDTDYKWAVVGHPGRDLFWVLSRQRQMDEPLYQDILKRAAAQGYDISQVRKVEQPTN